MRRARPDESDLLVRMERAASEGEPQHTRRGFGSALLGLATDQIFDGAVLSTRLWVLTENPTAGSFYAKLRWAETGRRRACKFPPFPQEVELSRGNPATLLEQRGT